MELRNNSGLGAAMKYAAVIAAVIAPLFLLTRHSAHASDCYGYREGNSLYQGCRSSGGSSGADDDYARALRKRTDREIEESRRAAARNLEELENYTPLKLSRAQAAANCRSVVGRETSECMAAQTATATVQQYLAYQSQQSRFGVSGTAKERIDEKEAPELVKGYCKIIKKINRNTYNTSGCTNYQAEIAAYYARRHGKQLGVATREKKGSKQHAGDQTNCVKYNRKTGKWENSCGVSVLIGYDTGQCKAFGGRGTAGPVKAHSSGDYNPLLKSCKMSFKACSYEAWVKGTCGFPRS